MMTFTGLPVQLKLFLLGLCLSLALVPSQAMALDDDEQPKCTAENSQVMTINQIWSNQRRINGKCVALFGYRLGAVIFLDQIAFYRYTAAKKSAPKGIVGIPYSLIYDLRKDDTQRLMSGTYYGRLESCRRHQSNYRKTSRSLSKQSATDEIILVHLYGFCASSKGPAIRVETAQEKLSPSLKRLTGSSLRKRLGELISVEDDYQYSKILPWLISIATQGNCTGDLDPGPAPTGGPPEGNGKPVIKPRFETEQATKIKQWCASKKQETLLYRVSDESPEFEAGVKLDLVICLCLTSDCSESGPVALIDTGWKQQGRPYFCQRVALRPRRASYPEEGEPEYSKYSFDFMNEYIVGGNIWQDWGFPEPTS